MDADTGEIKPANEVLTTVSVPTWDELAFKKDPIPSVFNEIKIETPKETVMDTNEMTNGPNVTSASTVEPKVVVAIPADSITRDCQAWAESLQMEKVMCYNFLRGLVSLNKAIESHAERQAGQKGKRKVLYSISPSVVAFLINQ
jgi:hypothetical protein